MTSFMGLIAVIAAAMPASPAQEEDAMTERSLRIRSAFNDLDKDTMHLLDDFYAEDVVFADPLGEISGLDDLRAYYEAMYRNVQRIRFDFTGEVAEGDTHVVVWTMTVEAKGLNRGRPVSIEGNSVIRFGEDDKVVYHRDYFDLGAMVYEHVPVVRFLVKKVKQKLAHH